MSDYGDDYSDYGDDFFYVEDEYMIADDLAEHAVASPPPTAYDDDALDDWDRFDYFNDLEYTSDGYDDGKFEAQRTSTPKTGEKRKRAGTGGRSKKKQKVAEAQNVQRNKPAVSQLPPVVWCAQADRVPKPKMWDGRTEPYALLKDWRETCADVPAWTAGSTPSASVAEALPQVPDYDDEEDEEDKEGEPEIDPTALMAALQNQLSAAGGPLAGMDPEQLLQFAMRMMSNQDAGDDIAGEMADQLLGKGDDGEDEDDGEEVPADLLSWLDKQRQSNQDGSTEVPKSPEPNLQSKRPPTPPSSEANRSILAVEETTSRAKGNSAAVVKQNNVSLEVEGVSTRKRKADDDVAGDGKNAPKRRATRSYDAPTAASQARAAPAAKTTRTTRPKRS